ncbi:MAG: hypothetical protein L6R40_006576 [Gallowayella cf. fulva]|nr:MAG: hypothetical protein L6R40_006576 [Xanthomendoza cf. fulva]
MPHSRNVRKLFKDSDDLTDLAAHLRPRGSYDPLPPPGGYPLPAYIRRKFSFAPQLPNISKISLMPDFASSSLDLSIEPEKSSALFISHTTPVSLWVQYNPERSSSRRGVERQQKTSRPSLPRINTNLASGTQVQRADGGVAVVLPSNGRRNSQQLNTRHAGSSPKSVGQRSLRMQTASTIGSDHYPEWDRLSSYTQVSSPGTPETVISSAGEEVYRVRSARSHSTTGQVSHTTRADEVESRLLKRLAERSPNVLGSFCIIDLQLPGFPIRVTSHDMLPVDLAPDEVLFLDRSDLGPPYQIKTASDGKKELQILPIVADLVDIDGASARPSHLVVGQIDLTDFLQSESDEDEDEDVWLTIAYEELEKAGMHYALPRGYRSKAASSTGAERERSVELIRSLHRDYFIIGMSGMDQRQFGITMVSPTLYASKELRRKDFLDFPKLASRLNIPQRFVTRVKWGTAGLRDKLYCVPMSGPHLVCWLCFLVDSDLPDIWARM